MVKLTLIARVRDGLPLAEGLDTDKEHEMYSYKSQAKVCPRALTRILECWLLLLFSFGHFLSGLFLSLGV